MSRNVLSKAKAELVELIKREGEVSIGDATEALGLAPTTVRQHMTGLEAGGFVSKRLCRAGAGRPSQAYYLTDQAQVFFVHREGELLGALVRALNERGELDSLAAFFERLGRDRVRQWSPLLRGKGREVPAALEELLKEWGYVPECRIDEKGDLVIEFFHCPYPNLSALVDYPCVAERNSMEELLGRPLKWGCSMREGQGSCRFVAEGFSCPQEALDEEQEL